MSLIYIPRIHQANGQFNGGEILEKKPIGFPQDDGLLRPYSNLFYWAHAWTERGSTIGEHPHKGFEILTFVLRGEIEHYDNKHKNWKKLTAGDVQIIRSGNGIIHSEKMLANSAMFQVWFDPNLQKTMNQPASYDDYSSEKFPMIIEKGRSTKIYKGDKSPLEMTTEGVEIKELSLSEELHTVKLNDKTIFSAFIMEGRVVIDEQEMKQDDFFIIREQNDFKIQVLTDCRLFVIETPLKPGYKTYAELHNLV
jgi:quercetin 2,3-dioxygenase